VPIVDDEDDDDDDTAPALPVFEALIDPRYNSQTPAAVAKTHLQSLKLKHSTISTP
jgi:hypothetical protein